jgi:phosphopantothenoylcysteine decarboxylase
MSLEVERRPRVLLGLTGSIATVKWAKLVLELSEFVDVRVLWTAEAEKVRPLSRSYDPQSFAAAEAAGYTAPPLSWVDGDEWSSFTAVHVDRVCHVDLRDWADAALIAPLSANTLSKLAHGACDGVLTNTLRAWPFAARRVCKPVLVCPAMNTAMWEHPCTGDALAVLQSFGYMVVPPVVKVLACGDTGAGAMAEVGDIVAAVRRALGQ